MPETSIEIDSETYDWREWVNEYINESKRLLTVRRKNVLFKHLYRFGARTLERKHAVEIDLTAYELDICTRVGRRSSMRSSTKSSGSSSSRRPSNAQGITDLKETPGLSKAEFAEKIRNLD